MPRPFPPDNSEVESGPIVPVNCDSCQVRKDQKAELSRYRAFVDELKEFMGDGPITRPRWFNTMLRKHGLEGEE